ncbi:hypothetical protein YTPLAS18_20760 [Nitrospira sp.]|nr:hypothetical protein YTPLAS18_20760 [Nitrospira sp.]
MNNPQSTSHPASSQVPSREELNAELLPVPESPDSPEPVEPPGFDDVIAAAVRYVKGKRGGDLVAVLLVGSAARRMITPHSDLDLIVVVKADDVREELIRVNDRTIDIRYSGHQIVEEDLRASLRLPPLLRKARVLFEHDGVGTRLVETANDRFRQGPPRPSMYEQIRLKNECLHYLGKAEDLQRKSATSHYLLSLFFDHYLTTYYRLRGLWPSAPADMLRFLNSRDPAVGGLLDRFQQAGTLSERLDIGRQLTDVLLKDVPLPARID